MKANLSVEGLGLDLTASFDLDKTVNSVVEGVTKAAEVAGAAAKSGKAVLEGGKEAKDGKA